jgi:BolA protein
MPVQDSIEDKLQQDLSVKYLSIENESHRHSGPATESHFKVTVVADDFAGLSAVQRHRRIYALLAEELAGGVHALALHLYTPEEWQARQQQAPRSPDCRGGGK